MSHEVLRALQHVIERLHGARLGVDVRAFLVSPEAFLQIPGAREGMQEQLFVREDVDGLDLGLYIAPEVVGRLASDDPQRRLHAGNLEVFCIALEGVSHFVFVAWHANIGRPVTALELEMQAEVDKFAASWLLLAAQGQSLATTGTPLLTHLFAAYTLSGSLPAEERERYLVANRVAQRFCAVLVRSFADDGDGERIERAVHDFARQPLADKLRAA